MWCSLVLYGTKDLTAAKAFELANEIFKIFGIKPTYFSHYEVNPINDDLKVKRSKPDKMKNALQCGFYRDFYCSDSLGKFQDEKINFTYNQDYGILQGIKIATLYDETFGEKLDFLMRLVFKMTRIKYGIFFKFVDMFDGSSYNHGASYKNLYPYENNHLFYQSVINLNEGETCLCYIGKLRMVYTYNILNINHLNLEIGQQNLKEFILSNDENGILEQISDYQYIWKVNEKNIDRLNKILGEAGLLVSYELPDLNPFKKPRLP